MKTLKITLLLAAVVCLTVSFSSTKTIDKAEASTQVKKSSSYDLLVLQKKKKHIGDQG